MEFLFILYLLILLFLVIDLCLFSKNKQNLDNKYTIYEFKYILRSSEITAFIKCLIT